MAPRTKKDSAAPAKAPAATKATKAASKPAATKATKATKKTTALPSRSRKAAAATEDKDETEDDAAETNGAKPEKEEDVKAVSEGVTAKKAAMGGSKKSRMDGKGATMETKGPVKKRKGGDDDDDKPASKKTRTGQPAVAGKAINEVPKDVLDIFVFGEGTSGELGLGNQKHDNKKPVDVKRPRLNHNLDAAKVGVVQIACGGMHVVALTHDNNILTWGVNDDRALGRDTTWDGGVRNADDSDSDDEDEGFKEMNPKEATPGLVDFRDEVAGTKFVQVAATDSASFALTEDGRVYGWGTFRGDDGIIGFTETVRVQQTPVVVEGLKDIKRLAAGANHVLALDIEGKVLAWGSGGQFQLGRKAITRGGNTGLKPEAVGKFTRKHHAVAIAAGSYHSFYIDNYGQLYAWGLNNYSQTGHDDNAGNDAAMVISPKPVAALKGKTLLSIEGGMHHSLATTKDGELLTWGRVDGHQVGHPASVYNEDNTVFDEHNKPRILTEPTRTGRGKSVTRKISEHILTSSPDFKTRFVAAGTDNSFAITDKGAVYSWGFSANYQTGQGTTTDIETPTIIDNTAIRSRDVVWVGAGGQYSIIASPHPKKETNGVNGS